MHDDVTKWKNFPHYWPFVWGIHRSRWIPRTKASDAELWCFFDLRLNKRLSKQSRGWWFETLSRSLWRHCNEPCQPNRFQEWVTRFYKPRFHILYIGIIIFQTLISYRHETWSHIRRVFHHNEIILTDHIKLHVTYTINLTPQLFTSIIIYISNFQRSQD